MERFHAEGFGFLFDNTSCVVLVFASLFPQSLPFNFYCECDFIWSKIVYQFCYMLMVIFRTLIV